METGLTLFFGLAGGGVFLWLMVIALKEVYKD
jgi:hypothetical protein